MLDEANLLWRTAQARFERTYGADRAEALRFALADIFSDEFADAFLRD